MSIEEIRARHASCDYTAIDRQALADIWTLLAEIDRLTKSVDRVRDLHAKVEHPTHGCCGTPQLCDGHAPECRSPEHPIGGARWPCATLRALGVTE